MSERFVSMRVYLKALYKYCLPSYLPFLTGLKWTHWIQVSVSDIQRIHVLTTITSCLFNTLAALARHLLSLFSFIYVILITNNGSFLSKFSVLHFFSRINSMPLPSVALLLVLIFLTHLLSLLSHHIYPPISPLSPSITLSVLYSSLKTQLFHNSFPTSQDCFCGLELGPDLFHRIHRIHRRQHASEDDAGISKHRLSPYNANYHNWLTLNFTASDSSSDKGCFLKVLIVLQLFSAVR